MIKVIRLKRAAAVCIASVLMIACAVAVGSERARTVSGEYIKWVDFAPTTSALRQALDEGLTGRDAVKRVSEQCRLPKNQVYACYTSLIETD